MCGEKMMKAGSNCAMLGSPPRMRGKGCRDKVKHCFHGITPAYAGKRRKTGHQNHDAEDHPRVCGEKEPSADSLILTSGSPPRMRGKGPPPRYSGTCTGITPAYAGKSYHVLCNCGNSRDHPRVCGEKSAFLGNCCAFGGSPPRMRGKDPWQVSSIRR